MRHTARSRFAVPLTLLTASCFTVHCADQAAPSKDTSPSETSLTRTGQSGSEAMGGGGLDTLSCPCGVPDWLPGAGVLLRVTLVAQEVGLSESSRIAKCRPSQRATAWDGPPPLCARLRLRVEEVLHGVFQLEVGSEIEADSDGFLPCYWHLGGVEVGQQALAVMSWPLGELPECAARQECEDACVRSACPDAGAATSDAASEASAGNDGTAQCGTPDVEAACADGRCLESTAALCPPRSLPTPSVIEQDGIAQLTPWGESLLFAQTDQARLEVPASELPLLWGNQQQCQARFGDWAELPGAFPGGVAP